MLKGKETSNIFRGFGERGRMMAAWALSLVCLIAQRADCQLIFNEGNAVGATQFVDVDLSKPYEGYDFGVIPYSGNINSTRDPISPGNPFPPDVDADQPDIQTTLSNGWNGTTGWGRIQGNGGDWFELVVTEDHTDLRGYTILWANDEDDPLGGSVGRNPDERGFIKFTQDKAWSDFRAGTIITFSEDRSVDEIRDEFPDGAPAVLLHDTGFNYDLSTDTRFNPFTADDWHTHFHVDESLTDNGLATRYFEAYSDIKVDNDFWQISLYDARNTTITEDVRNPALTSLTSFRDLATGLVHGPIGEAIANWGANVDAGSVNNQELLALRAAPLAPQPGNTLMGAHVHNYEDVDFSTFGMPNMFNVVSEGGLDGVQDFHSLRQPVLANTYQWRGAGASPFSTATNWENADTQVVAATGPAGNWTVHLHNTTASAKRAVLSANANIEFASIMSTGNGSMAVEVGPSATLTAAKRILVMEGGHLEVNGSAVADKVEAFSGATIAGNGNIDADLMNHGGIVAPGSLDVLGNYLQTSDATLAIAINGSSLGQFGALTVSGLASLAGNLQIDLGFVPITGATFPVLTAASIAGTVSLTGDSQNFTLIQNGVSLVLRYTGTSLAGDLNGDGAVDAADAGLMFGNWGNSGMGDITRDGVVDAADAGEMFAAWTGDAGPSVVPEPSGLLALLCLAVSARRKALG